MNRCRHCGKLAAEWYSFSRTCRECYEKSTHSPLIRRIIPVEELPSPYPIDTAIAVAKASPYLIEQPEEEAP